MTQSTERPDLELKSGILLDADGMPVPAAADPGSPSRGIMGFLGIIPFAVAGIALFAAGAGLIVAFALGLSLYALLRMIFPSRRRPGPADPSFRSRIFVIRR